MMKFCVSLYLVSMLSDEALMFYCYESFGKIYMRGFEVNYVSKAVLASILRRVSALRLGALK